MVVFLGLAIATQPPVIWFATYPHTGNTWIRNIWDVATGIASGTVFLGENDKHAVIHGRISVHPCGTNSGRSHLNDCAMIRPPRYNEALFVKTHFPTIKTHEMANTDKVVITHRSATSWCDAHLSGRRHVYGKKYDTIADCIRDTARDMENHVRWWTNSSLNMLVLNYNKMVLSRDATKGALKRLFEFAETEAPNLEHALATFPGHGWA